MGQLTKQFGKIKVEVEIPHLLNLQVDSYRKFMQEGRTERLPDEGLEGVFRSVFPIEDFNRTASLEFVSYEVGEPKYDRIFSDKLIELFGPLREKGQPVDDRILALAERERAAVSRLAATRRIEGRLR